MTTILTISHYIYLTREERYQIFNQIQVDVMGMNVPVWFNKGTTSEPAKEIFCRYYITNGTNYKSIHPILEGYAINIPQKLVDFESDKPISTRLLDVKDGGCEELIFKQNAKIIKENISYNVFHFIEIKSIEMLLETMVQ